KAAITYPNTVIRYACKALTVGAILRIVRSEGLHIDAVSINEVHRALRAGFIPAEILYTGEGASKAVYEELLTRGVIINCSSIDQLRLIGAIRPGSACSIRINPGEGHGSNNKVNTGGPASKHGIYLDALEQVRDVASTYQLRILGVHSHIGSGTDLDHWLRIKDLTLAVARSYPDLEFIDLGGGLPIVYDPSVDKPMPLNSWGEALSRSFESFSAECGRNIQLQIEPGRFVVAESGVLVAEVQTIKRTPDYKFIIVNTGLNHNPRPAMYGSYHPIDFISHDGLPRQGMEPAVVGGYLCESGDIFTVMAGGELAPRPFPNVELGDLMVMGHVGAYSHAMKSEYNSMNLPASVLIEQSGKMRLIERRGTLEDIIRREVEVYEEGRI
ncbi:MAG: diaminopimelate decarboxylase, partial [Proteobacteria bacterium]|nr:diaminopimelate decarboxylase [Pseudomonadota bacterium]